ncbi:MAG: tetratricopeptide repeat protein [Sulfuritalea sp.]|nr:tetratricopeptide repeat protein [Sulfuritalea sp.]
MSPVLSAVLLAAVIFAHSAAHAQSSMLRVTCEGADIGAEVSVNGTFKGECPLDIRVSAGTAKLRVVKKGSGMGERVFEQDIRLGDGVEKTIVALLSGNRLPAEGTQDVAPALVPSQPDLLSRLQGIWCWDSGGVSGKTTFAGNSVQVRAGLGIFSGSNHGTVAVLNDRQFRISLTNREDIVTFVDSDNIRWDKDGTVARRCDQSLVAGADRQKVENRKSHTAEEIPTAAPRLATERSGRENKPLVAQPAESKRRRGQTDTAAAQVATPPRPAIPLGISEEVWKIIEASEAYRKLPQPRTSKVVFQGKGETEYTGSKSKSLPNPGAKSTSTTRVTVPVGDKCTVTVTNTATDGKSDGVNESYYCGFIWLGFASGGKPTLVIRKIDELKGSLFPMRVGARLTKRYQTAYLADRKYDSTNTVDCTVVGRLAAQELDSRLAGAAWKVHCKSSYNASNLKETDDYYVEDLGVMLSTIGAYDTSRNAHVLPSPGSRTLIEAEGDYGSRNITSYASYNWDVGGVYEMPAPVGPPTVTASTNDGSTAAERDKSSQREQLQPAGSTDEKALAQLLKAAADGNASAMTQLGARYEKGNGVTKDLVQATAWYRKAAKAGDIAGMAGYGDMLFNGTSTSYSSMDGARTWWSKAAGGGNGRALRGMGRLYFSGWAGLPRDTEKAMVLFEKAVEAGESLARNDIAQVLDYDPSARRFLKNGNILQARSNSVVEATSQAPQAEESPASGGSDLFGAMLGGLASGLVDHAAAQINSAAASTGGADGIAMGVLGSITTQLARETKDQVARDRGGNGQADASLDPTGSALVNSLAGAIINQTNNVTASALAGDGHTGMAALVGNMNSAMLSSLQGSGSTGGNSGGAGMASGSSAAVSGAAASPKASAGSARIFVVSRSTREEACEVSKRMTKQDGQEITGTCSCNTLFNSNNCRAEVVGPKGAAATPEQLAAAKECATPSKQKAYGYRSTGNAQFDAGCSLVAFDVCLAKTTGLSTYTQEANIQCSVLRRTMKVAGGGSLCELPCAAAAKLPVADPCQYLKNCTK